jgi:hypothetical protein
MPFSVLEGSPVIAVVLPDKSAVKDQAGVAPLKITENVVPKSSELCTVILALCIRAMLWAMASPNP